MEEKKIKQLLETIFTSEIQNLQFYPKGLTNENWLFSVDHIWYLLRYPTFPINDYHQEYNVIMKLQDAHLDVETIYFDYKTGIKITKYIDYLTEFKDEKRNSKIEEVAVLMKQLHQLQIQTNVFFDPLSKLEQYQKKVKHPLYSFEHVQDLCQKIQQYSQTGILCHNDWVSGNILFSNTRNYLIDYEYAADNDPLSDIMSFLTENNIESPAMRSRFYHTYFGTLPDTQTMNRLNHWEQFHNMLWCWWAMMMYEEKKETVYLEIAEMKYTAYQKARFLFP